MCMRYWPRLFLIPAPTLLLFNDRVAQPFFNFLQIFTYVPYNFWFWLLIIAAPILVFSAKPDSNPNWRVNRLLIAIGLTYIFINLSLHTSRQIKWAAYEQCQSQFSDGSIQHHKECGEIDIADGASNIFYLVLGWLPAATYVAIYEFVWRLRYRRTIREQGNTYQAKWASNIVIILGAPLILYAIFGAWLITISYLTGQL